MLLLKAVLKTYSMLLKKPTHEPALPDAKLVCQHSNHIASVLMVTRATVTSSKTVDFSFRGHWLEAHTVFLSSTAIRRQYAFESVAEYCSMGIVDFVKSVQTAQSHVRRTLQIKIKTVAWLDRRLHFVDSLSL